MSLNNNNINKKNKIFDENVIKITKIKYNKDKEIDGNNFCKICKKNTKIYCGDCCENFCKNCILFCQKCYQSICEDCLIYCKKCKDRFCYFCKDLSINDKNCESCIE